MREPSGGNGWDAGGRIHWAEDPAPLSGSQPNYLPMPAMPRFFTFDRLQPPVCRLGLATRGNTRLTGDDVLVALERGLNYWNWCGHQDGMADAIRQLGPRRKQRADCSSALGSRRTGSPNRNCSRSWIG